MPINTDISHIRRKAEHILIICMPFPLQPQLTSIKFITLHRRFYRIRFTGFRFTITAHRVSTTVAVLINSNYRPVIYPFHRIQMQYTSISSLILKMQKPGFSGRSVYPSSLMRSVDVRLSLRHHNSGFIRSIHIFRTHHQLPSGNDSTRRCKQIVKSIPLIKLSSLNGMIYSVISVEHQYRVRNDCRTFLIHLAHRQHTVEFRSASSPCMSQIHTPVVIP